MSRSTVIITSIFITVLVLSVALVFMVRPVKISQRSYQPVVVSSANKSVFRKYNHEITKSNGDGQIFNNKSLCVVFPINDKIVGGSDATLGDVPYIALLEYQLPNDEYSFDCSGSLINQRYVVTAAHCLYNKNLVNIRLGEHDFLKTPDCDEFSCQPEPIDIGFESIIVHQNYLPQMTGPHDIGLIRLAKDVPYVQYAISPICIPFDNMSSPINQKMLVAGWGSNGTIKQMSVLQIGFLSPYNWAECQLKFKSLANVSIYPSQLCAGGEEGKDSCIRDSGGPLVLYENGKTYLEGIVSYGSSKCGQSGWPGIYTRVGYYYDWIVANLKP